MAHSSPGSEMTVAQAGTVLGENPDEEFIVLLGGQGWQPGERTSELTLSEEPALPDGERTKHSRQRRYLSKGSQVSEIPSPFY